VDICSRLDAFQYKFWQMCLQKNGVSKHFDFIKTKIEEQFFFQEFFFIALNMKWR
jgi:hypothetical protein